MSVRYAFIMELGLAYELIVVGVNKTPGSPVVLEHAEDDGVRYAGARLSALGPANLERRQHLIGARATRRAVDRALVTAAGRRPHFLELAFDGHGNEDGIGLADGVYPFSLLERRLRESGAHGVLVTLNSCRAGGFVKGADVHVGALGDVEAAWEAGLFASVPGVRGLLASSSDGTTKEVRGVGSIFRRALLAAMFDRRPGDLEYGGVEFASARLVLARAAPLMAQFGVHPIYFGPDAGWCDFPMVIANRQILGAVEARVAPTQGLGAHVRLAIQGRRYLPTEVVVTPTDAFGVELPSMHRKIVPSTDDVLVTEQYHVDPRNSAACLHQLASYGATRMAWRVSVIDHNHMMVGSARQVIDHVPI